MAITRLGPNQDITAAKIAGQINFKNLIINGDMSIAQRGTQAVGGSTGLHYGGCDRLRVYQETTASAYTLSQDTNVPTAQGFANSFKLDVTTADASLTAGDRVDLIYRFEGQELQQIKKGTSSAESLTLSFWVSSPKTGTHICEMYDADNARQISKSYTVSSANTWEKKIITFEGDTSGALNNDNNLSLQISWWLMAGSNYSSGTLSTSWTSNTGNKANRAVGQVNVMDSTSNNFYLTGVQLEADTAASDFEFLPYDVNLRRCQRYYYYLGGTNNTYKRISTNITNPNNRNQTAGLHFLPVPMRDAPTITIPSAGSFYGVWIGGANTFSSMTISNQSEASSDPDFSVLRVSGTLSSNVGNHCVQVEMTYASTNKMEVSAEL